jgi:SAM-dependent methyltransferase
LNRSKTTLTVFSLAFSVFISFKSSANDTCINYLEDHEIAQEYEVLDPNEPQNHKLYENAVGLYEAVFKPFFIGGVKKSINRIKELQPKNILEVGTGTGYSLKYYPNDVYVVGVDISHEMVRRSRERADELKNEMIRIHHIAELPPEKLEGSADVVASFSVITVVPDPQKFLTQLTDYTLPGGHIVLIMHMRGEGLAGVIDKSVDFLTQKLFGFTLLRRITDYDLSAFESVDFKPVSKFLFYPYNHIVVLKKKR